LLPSKKDFSDATCKEKNIFFEKDFSDFQPAKSIKFCLKKIFLFLQLEYLRNRYFEKNISQISNLQREKYLFQNKYFSPMRFLNLKKIEKKIFPPAGK